MFTLVKALHTTLAVPTCVVLLNHGKLENLLDEIGIKVYVIDESRLNSFQIIFSLIRIIREQSPDVIHTHRVKENILGSFAALLAGTYPSMRTTHGAPEHHPSLFHIGKHLIVMLDNFCGRFLQQKIIAVSHNLGSILKSKFPSKKIHVIENGIDIENTIINAKSKNATDSAEKSAFKIGIAGRLVPVKRVDIFIETARYMLDHHPDMKLTFHVFGDGPLQNELIKLNQELHTVDFVYFEGHIEQIGKKLVELDALLMTSDHEGLPMVLLEAMVLHVPIVAHAVGGIPDLLGQGSCGILVNNHNSAGYGEELYHLLNNTDMKTRIQRKAYDRACTKYSADNNARAYLSEYLSIAQLKHN